MNNTSPTSAVNAISISTVGQIKTTQKISFFVRCLFDYDPVNDSDLPSRGLKFKHGYILHVTNASDDEWWLANIILPKEDDDNSTTTTTTTGIVPSKRRIERKERSRYKYVKFRQSTVVPSISSTSSLSSTSTEKQRRRGLKRNITFSRKFPFVKRIKDQTNFNDSISMSEDGLNIRSYQAVYQETIDYTRPVIIFGPFKHRLNDDLLAEFPDKFSSCVPHTTRPKRPNEINGKDYHFVECRETMQKNIDDNLFIEAGQFNDNLYGTSISAVRQVAGNNCHCVLDVSPNALKRLHSSKLAPIAILVKANKPDNLIEWNSQMSIEEAKKLCQDAINIEHEFFDYLTAIVSGNTVKEVYPIVKQIIRDQSTQVIWTASDENILC